MIIVYSHSTPTSTNALCAVPETPALQVGDVVITDTSSGAVRITGRILERKRLTTGAWVLTLVGYVGEPLGAKS